MKLLKEMLTKENVLFVKQYYRSGTGRSDPPCIEDACMEEEPKWFRKLRYIFASDIHNYFDDD